MSGESPQTVPSIVLMSDLTIGPEQLIQAGHFLNLYVDSASQPLHVLVIGVVESIVEHMEGIQVQILSNSPATILTPLSRC